MQTKPFLRWAGSKRKQLSRLRQFWGIGFERYLEPFAGSACLFFDIQPASAILSDSNEHLIDMYQVVRDHADEVYDLIEAIPRTSETYYSIRSKSRGRLSKIKRAARFIYLNRNCFNGIYRTNQAGAFNVPFASSRAGEFVSREEFRQAAALLRNAKLKACDFGTTLKEVRSGDFVYLDPPFVVASRRVFKEYGAKTFGPPDIERLDRHIARIDGRGAAFLVSYADCRESRLLASKWNSCRMRVRRHIAGFHGARRSSFERLITNISFAERASS